MTTAKRSIYLDNNATTQIAPEVFDAMSDVLKNHFGNPSSAGHSFGWFAAELVEVARERVANSINADPEEIIFTSGATESNNIVLKSVLATSNSSVVSAKTEHKAVLDPIAFLKTNGCRTRLLEVKGDGHIDYDDLKEKISEQPPTLLSLMFANNEIGTIHDLKKASEIVKGSDTLFHSDASQALGKIQIDVRKLGVDFLSLSGHKAYGPKGVGALFVRRGLKNKLLTPLFHGGGHEQGLRAGTLNVAAIVGFGKACELAKKRLSEDEKHLNQLYSELVTGLQKNLGEVLINGPTEDRLPGNLNFSIPSSNSAAIIAALSTKVAVSSGSACQSAKGEISHVLKALHLNDERSNSAIRVGIGRYNTSTEVSYFLCEISKLV